MTSRYGPSILTSLPPPSGRMDERETLLTEHLELTSHMHTLSANDVPDYHYDITLLSNALGIPTQEHKTNKIKEPDMYE